MFQEKLSELRPYVTGIRFVKDLPVVDVLLLENWDMFETESITYKPSNNNNNYYVIDFNIEKENKLSLLKAKIEELKFLFSDKPLKELERLKFVIESIDEPTLKDIKTDVNKKVHNGIELPPTNSNGKLVEDEKEGV